MFEQKKEKWLSFQDLSSMDKTMVLVTVPGETRPLPNPNHFNSRIDWMADEYGRRMEISNWLDDDSIPCICVYTGTEIFAEAFGCNVYRPEDNMPFALHRVANAAELSRIKLPDIQSSSLAQVFELAERLRQRVGRDALMQLPDIQSPFGIAALIWEKSDFLMSTLEDPAAVKELTAMTEELLTNFLDQWFALYGTDYIAHYPDYFMRGGLTLSEDEIGEISRDLFMEFCFESLNRLSDRYGGIGIHCCANARHQWDHLKKIHNLKMLNLIQPKDVIQEAYLSFSPCCGQMHSWYGDGEPSLQWINNYPADAHVVLQYTASGREDALEKLKILREIAYSRRGACGPH